MHFRNSWTRSMSSCCQRQSACGTSAGGRERLDRLVDLVVPRHVGHEVADQREGPHRLDRDRLGPRSKSDSRVLHVRRGRPLTSALHEPHFAALQFQRTARSGAPWPWIQWSASRTTIPSSTGTSNVDVAPPARPGRRPRKTSHRGWSASGCRRPAAAERSCRSSGELRRQRQRSVDASSVLPSRADRRCSSGPSRRRRVRVVEAAVRAPALGPLERAARDRLGDDRAGCAARTPGSSPG